MLGAGSLVNQTRITAQAAARHRYLLDGIIQRGSYDPKDGTVTVTQGLGAAAGDLDPDDQPRIHQRVPLIVFSGQHGPIGGERVVLLPLADGGYVAAIIYQSEDSPHAPSGQTWLGLGRDLDQSEDAVIRKSDLDAALAAQMSQLKSDLAAWASASLQGGGGAGGPSELTAIHSMGSSKVKAFP